MVTRIGRTIALAAMAALLLPAQSGRIAHPTAGFVFDPAAHALRPVKGIPGSALIGDPVSLQFELAAAFFSPQQDAVLAIAADDSVHFLRIRSGEASERLLDGVAKPQRVVFSPRGSAAALISGAHVAILAGLPDNPALGASLDLDDSPASLALSDDAAYLLVAASGSLRLLGAASGENLKLMDAAEGAIAAFAPGNYDAAVADAAGAGLLLFRNAPGGGEPQLLTAPDDSIASPVGLAFSANKRKLFVASSAARAVASFDLDGGDRGAIACSCTPAALVGMGGVFRLNELGSEPLWLLDPGADEPRIVFVPALRTE